MGIAYIQHVSRTITNALTNFTFILNSYTKYYSLKNIDLKAAQQYL